MIPLSQVVADPHFPEPTMRDLYNIPSIQDWLKEEIQPWPPASLLDLASHMAARLAAYQEFTLVELDFLESTRTSPAEYLFWTWAEHNSCQMAELLLNMATKHFFPYVHVRACCELQVQRQLSVLRAFRARETKQLLAQVDSGTRMEQGNTQGDTDSDEEDYTDATDAPQQGAETGDRAESPRPLRDPAAPRPAGSSLLGFYGDGVAGDPSETWSLQAQRGDRAHLRDFCADADPSTEVLEAAAL